MLNSKRVTCKDKWSRQKLPFTALNAASHQVHSQTRLTRRVRVDCQDQASQPASSNVQQLGDAVSTCMTFLTMYQRHNHDNCPDYNQPAGQRWTPCSQALDRKSTANTYRAAC